MFTKLEAFLKGKKTHIVAFLLVLVAAVNLYNGDIALEAFLGDPNLLILLNGLGLSALRAAVDK